jgi:YD repeat-containing protein
MSVAPSGPIIDGWQKVEGIFEIPSGASQLEFTFNKEGTSLVYYDDIRIHPYNSNMKSYVYDPINLRLTAELNENNFATIYEYDEEGTLIRTKAETEKGIKTIQETRSHQQRTINTFQ